MNRKKTKCTLFWIASKRQAFLPKTLFKNTVEMRQIRFFQQKHHKTQLKTSHEVTLHVTYSGKSCRFLLRVNHFDLLVVEKKIKYSPNGWFKEWWFLKPHAVESRLKKKQTTHQHHQTHPAPKKVGVDPTTWLFWPRLVVGRNHHHW